MTAITLQQLESYLWGAAVILRGLVDEDPIYLADKPRRPQRMPVWLEREEQERLQNAARSIDDLPDNIFGRTRAGLDAARAWGRDGQDPAREPGHYRGPSSTFSRSSVDTSTDD